MSSTKLLAINVLKEAWFNSITLIFGHTPLSHAVFSTDYYNKVNFKPDNRHNSAKIMINYTCY